MSQLAEIYLQGFELLPYAIQTGQRKWIWSSEQHVITGTIVKPERPHSGSSVLVPWAEVTRKIDEFHGHWWIEAWLMIITQRSLEIHPTVPIHVNTRESYWEENINSQIAKHKWTPQPFRYNWMNTMKKAPRGIHPSNEHPLEQEPVRPGRAAVHGTTKSWTWLSSDNNFTRKLSDSRKELWGVSNSLLSWYQPVYQLNQLLKPGGKLWCSFWWSKKKSMGLLWRSSC